MNTIKPLKGIFILAGVLTLLLLLLAACGGSAPAAPASSTGGQATATTASVVVQATATPASSASAQATATTGPGATPIAVSGGQGCAANAQKLTWFVGLGAGGDPDVVPKEKDWVDNFNKSQTDYCLILQVMHNPESYDTLKARLAAGGDVPDIVGPVGRVGMATFKGAWVDLTPLATKSGFDLNVYDKTLLDFVKDTNGQLIALPFALYPGVLYYNKKLFDEAELPYPPHKVGDKYQGKDWNLDTFTELAKKLTVDKAGNTPLDAKFDPKSIQQFGAWMAFTDARRFTALFGGGIPYDPANPTVAKIPDNWKQAWHWYYDGMWKDWFMPNSDYMNSDQFGKGNSFSSGNVAMTWSFTWYTCCFDMAKLPWDIAVPPTVNGKLTAGGDIDNFAILKQSKNQDAAFKVLTQMALDKELPKIFGSLPGKKEDRPDWYAAMQKRAEPNKIDWTVADAMLNYPDIPNHEAWVPNQTKANDLFQKFGTLMQGTPNLNLDDEITKVQSQLDALFKEPGAIPAQ